MTATAEHCENKPIVVETSDLIWGAANIARFVNRTETQTFYLLSRGLLPAKKVGEQWLASKRSLLELVA